MQIQADVARNSPNRIYVNFCCKFQPPKGSSLEQWNLLHEGQSNCQLPVLGVCGELRQWQLSMLLKNIYKIMQGIHAFSDVLRLFLVLVMAAVTFHLLGLKTLLWFSLLFIYLFIFSAHGNSNLICGWEWNEWSHPYSTFYNVSQLCVFYTHAMFD